jgi:predicted DNA-binding antitoxin AbrB/MazE fold protein
MTRQVKAVYGGGVCPLETCDLPEGSEVHLTIQGSRASAPRVTDAAERHRILKALVERMRANPIPRGALRLNREALHERR